jgi:hypothetical protein
MGTGTPQVGVAKASSAQTSRKMRPPTVPPLLTSFNVAAEPPLHHFGGDALQGLVDHLSQLRVV